MHSGHRVNRRVTRLAKARWLNEGFRCFQELGARSRRCIVYASGITRARWSDWNGWGINETTAELRGPALTWLKPQAPGSWPSVMRSPGSSGGKESSQENRRKKEKCGGWEKWKGNGGLARWLGRGKERNKSRREMDTRRNSVVSRMSAVGRYDSTVEY